MEEIFEEINRASEDAEKAAEKQAEQEAKAYESEARKRIHDRDAAIAERAARRAAILKSSRRRVTISWIKHMVVASAFAGLIYWAKYANCISPHFSSWLLVLAVAFVFYDTGCWQTCLEFWKE